MNHLQAILNAYQKNKASFLATIVNTKGSTYRRTGARMLVTKEGEITGMVSAGCLEQDIFHHIQQKIEAVDSSFQPFLITYDITTNEDISWGFGLGCDGVVQILVESLEDNAFNPMTFISKCLQGQQIGVLATIFQVEGDINVQLGTKLMMYGDGSITHNFTEMDLYRKVATDAQKVINTKQSAIHQYSVSSGKVQIFIEAIQPPTPLVIFGAGRDAIPLAQFAKALGWNLTIVDCRSLEATANRFSIADQVIPTRREILSQQITPTIDTVAVIMTHNYYDDLEILKLLLPSPALYVGLLGSRNRTQRLLQELRLQQTTYTIEQLRRLHAPIGLDIGAETPEEIAIAIVAEIQTQLSGRNGGFLKNRQTAMHPA